MVIFDNIIDNIEERVNHTEGYSFWKNQSAFVNGVNSTLAIFHHKGVHTPGFYGKDQFKILSHIELHTLNEYVPELLGKYSCPEIVSEILMENIKNYMHFKDEEKDTKMFFFIRDVIGIKVVSDCDKRINNIIYSDISEINKFSFPIASEFTKLMDNVSSMVTDDIIKKWKDYLSENNGVGLSKRFYSPDGEYFELTVKDSEDTSMKKNKPKKKKNKPKFQRKSNKNKKKKKRN